jgi:hypothetical protein
MEAVLPRKSAAALAVEKLEKKCYRSKTDTQNLLIVALLMVFHRRKQEKQMKMVIKQDIIEGGSNGARGGTSQHASSSHTVGTDWRELLESWTLRRSLSQHE